MKIRKKLKSNRGESLAEALAACLIIALALTMLAQVMTGSVRAVSKTQQIRESNDAVMAAFWQDTQNGKTADKETDHQLTFDGFTMNVKLQEYDVTTDDGQTGHVYEFAVPKTQP